MNAAMPAEHEDAPSRPSTWQLLFGANKMRPAMATSTSDNQLEDEDSQRHARASPTPPTASSDVSSQLLQALQAREHNRHTAQDDAIGRQCSDELLGKRNAFAPQWRGGVATDRDDPATVPGELTREAKHQARELIHTRLRVDQHAEAIRRGKTREQQRRDDSRLRPATRAEPGMTERLKKLREIQTRRDEAEQARENERLRRERQQVPKGKRHPVETNTMKATARPEVSGATTSNTGVTAKRERERVAAKTPTITTRGPHSIATTGRKKPTPISSNQDEAVAVVEPPAPAATRDDKGRNLRALDDKLRHLQAENQRVVALEAKLQVQHHLVQIKRRVWAIWLARLARRRCREASVARAFEWKKLQRTWTAWRHAARSSSSDRAARHTREQLVHEKQQHEIAERFYRARHLLLWFQRWRAEARGTRDARQLAAAIQRRREKAARLMERFTRAQAGGGGGDIHGGPGQEHEKEHERDQKHPVSPPVRARGKPTPSDTTARTKPTPTEAWPAKHKSAPSARQASPDSSSSSSSSSSPHTVSGPETKPKVPSSAPSPDAFYVSMLERAEQRRAQREQLKLKYDKLEQEKRAALARQVAEREALLEKQKQEERERLREKKREEVRIARQKDAQRHVATIQQQSAALHDRLRLLYHYAFRPWQHAWRASQRVTRNARAWHVLRVNHKTWHTWQCFVRERHAKRRRQEQDRLTVAGDHHRRTRLRAVMATWKLAQRDTQQKQLAVKRHVQWSATRRTWRRWQHAYALVIGKAQQRETHARRALERRRVRLFLVAWREVAVDAKWERVRLAEKELLWKKARMWLNE